MLSRRVTAAVVLMMLHVAVMACNVPVDRKEGHRILGRVGSLQEGVYFSKVYLDTLRATRSPAEAYVSSGPLLWARVDKTNGTTTIHLVDTGGEVTALAFSTETFVPSQYGIRQFALEIRSEHSFCIDLDDPNLTGTLEGHREYVYVRIGDKSSEEHFVERLALAGRYVDEQGRSYVFEEDGKASFPDRNFNYSVAFEAVKGWSTFTEKSKGGRDLENQEPREFAFKWTNGKLMIHRVINPDVFEVEQRPLLELTPITGESS